MSFELKFIGGAGSVTGSKYLVTFKGKNLLVDCGLFQGLKALRLKNWSNLPIDPKDVDAVLLTHAHIDHSGYIPKLVKNGFRGKIFATAATIDLCKILLPDAGYLMEEEAAYLNKKKRTKHSPALPLFTLKDAQASLSFLEPVDFETETTILPDLSFKFKYAGHILGAASISIKAGDARITFTGDVGRPHDQILFAPTLLENTDFLVTESTYGNKLHSTVNMLDHLEAIVNQTVQKGGVIVVPAFAVGRAQALMHHLAALRKQGRIPVFPMYLNSPMATHAGNLMKRYGSLHRLTDQDIADIDSSFIYVRDAEESKALNKSKGPMLIISSSGMCTGGRVLHHLKAFAPFPQNTILLTGFQAAGTRGEALLNNAAEIKIHGEYIPVNARIENLDMSAHADYKELIQWFTDSSITPKKVFIVHGEPAASDELRRRLTEKFGWDCSMPQIDSVVSLG